MSRSLRVAALATAALTLSGCAGVTLGPGEVVSRTVVSTRREVERSSGALAADLRQSGTTVSVKVERACLGEERVIPTISTVTEYARLNGNPKADWILLVGGLASAGLGAAMIASPETFQSSSFSRRESVGWGVGASALGGTLLVVALIDVVRASGVERTTTKGEGNPTVVRKGVDCGRTPERGATLVARDEEGHAIHLGTTDATGEAQADLAGGETRALAERGGRWTFSVGDAADRWRDVGIVDRGPLLARLEDDAWKRLDPAACERSATAAHCAAVAEFLARFPGSARAAVADGALRAYRESREREQREAAALAAREEAAAAVAAKRQEAAAAAAAKRSAAAAAAAASRAKCSSGCRAACAGDGPCAAKCVQTNCK